MSQGDDDSEKSQEPSQKKLDDARKKGEIPKSNDLNTAAGYAGIVLTATTVGGASLQSAGGALSGAFILAGGDRGHSLSSAAMVGETFLAVAPWAVLPFGFVLLSILGQQSFTVTGSKLMPKGNRISILSNAKQKFGRSGLFEFFKSTVKLAIYSIGLFFYIAQCLPDILALSRLEPPQAAAGGFMITAGFFWVVLGVSASLGIVDLLWQRAEHMRKNRMSHKEMKDEHKDAEGDPHTKQQRRQRGMEIAMNQMMQDVPDASVIVVNPTHYAIALKWSRANPGAPVCVAKGVDEVALRIREIATKAGVPIHSDPPTARALHATTEIGAEIAPDHYAAVAVAIRFAEGMRKKARAR
ncbi:flagellar biosynthetic protein FlhB [Palleronia marisminoris]|uniref:Flagellar biosynthetic protein FlhB n=1 Tax=Palleronia marisminoris TaxID=315423 RepID=A0A1Y5ST02_9RHOB|nr:flagellar type III secretion system protein FlhB [Palleronia marisminoris]SFG95660.1 flagellar biosynthetic protein FlhB [Palleronia marisminoris]SLN47086.1 Flagellar biosynthetic protein FlhB [Palleronia marisminoris]